MFDGRSNLKFSDPFTIRQLLEDLDKPKFDNDLSMTTTMEKFKVFLLKHPEFTGYRALVQCPTFELKWETLYNNCKLERASTFKKATDNLRRCLEQKGWVLRHFRIFPVKPPKNYDNVSSAEVMEHHVHDYKRYIRELRELRDKEKHRLSSAEKTYLSYEISTSKTKVSGMKKFLPLSPSVGEKRKAPFEDASSTAASQPPAKQVCMDHLPNDKRKMMAIDFFTLAYPQMTVEEAYKKFSLLDPKDRAVFDRQEENIKKTC